MFGKRNLQPKSLLNWTVASGGVLLLASTLSFAGGHASAQESYPERPVTIVVPFSAGGITDGVARIVAAQLEQQTGQPFVIDNRSGAGGAIGAEAVANAEADGYTLLLSTTGIVSINPHMREVPYNPATDFTPVAMLGFSNGVMAIHPSVPATTVEEFVAYANENPGALFFSSGGVGTIAHLFGEMFKSRAEVQMQHVPFQGSGPALTDTIAGRAQVIFDTGAVPAVQEGQLVGLAVLGAEESPLLPGLPTLKSTGYGEDMLSWFGILAPDGVPQDIVDQLNAEIEAALQTEEVRSTLANSGITARFEDADEFTASMRRDYKAFGAVIERLGISER